MPHHRAATAIFGGAISLAALITTAGVAGAASYGSYSPSPTQAQPATPQTTSTHITVRTTTAVVGGKEETILVNAQGLPLYTFGGDTAAVSAVSGGLARLWPPVVSSTPRGTGVSGTLTSVKQPNGHQVAYNGHFLYTFVDDTPGHVTGQGVQGFTIATPNLKPNATTATTKTPVPTAPSSGYGYGG